MAAAAETERGEEFLIEAEFFRRNALLIIQEMVKLSTGTPFKHPELVDEVLHSILFLGHLHNPEYKLEDIVSDADILKDLNGRFPHPFKCYTTHLPKRAPISCVLEMIVKVTGQENEEKIYAKLLKLMQKLKEGKTKQLVSNTFCVSQPDNRPESARYYGVSMSTSGPNPGRIMVAASCLRYWDSYVAGAVMTYYPNKQKKEYFDGTITLPNEVRCQAFSLSQENNEMPPCRSCGNLFGLQTSDTTVWPYGNCAEPESLSNLLQNETEVRVNRARPNDEGRDNARESVLTHLRQTLHMLDFKWNEEFYTPQV